ncbi:hypothetical protein ACWD1Z_35260 [Streptomyces sp. NPDC002784]
MSDEAAREAGLVPVQYWQEIVEISAHSASGELTVRGLMDDLDEELPVWAAPPQEATVLRQSDTYGALVRER